MMIEHNVTCMMTFDSIMMISYNVTVRSVICWYDMMILHNGVMTDHYVMVIHVIIDTFFHNTLQEKIQKELGTLYITN